MDLPRILPLPQHVVEKIAAGEVIQRPFSVVKELIENAVDAGATQVTVTVKGSTSLIQVQDNGHGIHPDDFNMLCKRFNTSKLRSFDDLRSMKTYGFRGEALASMTHVARVTITSQKPGSPCAYRASYKEGALFLKPAKCAGVPGTTVTVEDLFYNVPQRLRGLKSASEEYNKILDVVQKYAVHHAGKVGFTVKRVGVMTPDLHTVASNPRQETISKIYGADVARELVAIKCPNSTAEKDSESEEDMLFSNFEGFGTNANYSRKKSEFLLFINGRLVDSSALKRVIDNAYTDCLPKGGHPFVYLSLDIPLGNIDVNVHPTKKEVQFLHESEIASVLESELRRILLGGNESRVFEVIKLRADPVQATLGRRSDITSTLLVDEITDDQTDPDAVVDMKNESSSPANTKHNDSGEEAHDVDAKIETDDENDNSKREDKSRANSFTKHQVRHSLLDNNSVKKIRRADSKLVRTDASMGSGMERFLQSKPSEDPASSSDKGLASAYIVKPQSLEDAPLICETSDALELESVKHLLKNVLDEESRATTDSIKKSVFVGVLDQDFSFIQCETSLIAINHFKFSQELFYQRVLTLFGRFRMFAVEPPLSVEDLLEGDQDMAGTVLERADLLFEYFGIDCRSDGKLKALPRLLFGHTPQLWAIPILFEGLAKRVNWNDEMQCLKTISLEIANAYSFLPDFKPLITTSPSAVLAVQLGDKTSIQYIMKNILHPAFKSNLSIPMRFTDSRNRCLIQIAKLEQMYKVFERC